MLSKDVIANTLSKKPDAPDSQVIINRIPVQYIEPSDSKEDQDQVKRSNRDEFNPSPVVRNRKLQYTSDNDESHVSQA